MLNNQRNGYLTKRVLDVVKLDQVLIRVGCSTVKADAMSHTIISVIKLKVKCAGAT
jgi:hypothetical protein